MPSMRDVAKLAGVSPAGVSRILSNDPAFRVKEQTRQRVLAAAEELNYSVPGRAEAETKKIGCVLSYTAKQYSDQYFMTILSSINQALHGSGCSLVSMFSKDEISEEKISGLSGLFVFDDTLDDIGRFKSAVPCVVGVDTDYPEIDNVGHDLYRTGLQAVEHLIQCGHSRIAYIGGGECALLGREQAFRDLMGQHGFAVPDGCVMDCGWKPELCYDMVKELCSQKDRPTAVFAGSDNLAIAVLSAVHSLGLSSPGDVAVSGVNNLDFSAFTSPSLTTVSIPMEEIGAIASELMLRRIGGFSGAPMKIFFPTTLIVRDSTRNIR